MPRQRDDDSVCGVADVADVGDGAGEQPGVGGRDQSADERAVYYYDLVTLMREHGAKLEKNERVYAVQAGSDGMYVVANSPGQAALAVCDVSRVPDKQLIQAAFEAMGVK